MNPDSLLPDRVCCNSSLPRLLLSMESITSVDMKRSVVFPFQVIFSCLLHSWLDNRT
jgi:hypothetical protein